MTKSLFLNSFSLAMLAFCFHRIIFRIHWVLNLCYTHTICYFLGIKTLSAEWDEGLNEWFGWNFAFVLCAAFIWCGRGFYGSVIALKLFLNKQQFLIPFFCRPQSHSLQWGLMYLYSRERYEQEHCLPHKSA